MFLHDWHKGRPFTNAGSVAFPYLEIDCLQFYDKAIIQDMRDAYHLLMPMEQSKPVRKALNERIFFGDQNEGFSNDIEWRANHLGAEIDFWDFVKTDIPSQLSEGFALGDDIPLIPEIGTKRNLDRSVMEHSSFTNSQLMRSIFRAFHRADGNARRTPRLSAHL